MARDIYLGSLSPRAMDRGEEANGMLQFLESAAPQFSPEVYNVREPINLPYDPNQRERILDRWSSSFFWKRRKLEVMGSLWKGEGKQHSSFFIGANSKRIDCKSGIEFLKDLARYLSSDISYIHLRTEQEGKIAEQRGMEQQTLVPLFRGLFTRDIRSYLPDLTWGMVFGPAYVKLFGRDRILSSPAYSVEELATDMVYIQLTESLFDLHERYDHVDDVRRRVKTHLGSTAFFDPSLGPDYPYFVPEFSSISSRSTQHVKLLEPIRNGRELLIESLVEFSWPMLKKFGEFYPFGGIINEHGEFEYFAAGNGRINTHPSALIVFLRDMFRALSASRPVRMAGICYNVRATDPSGTLTDAILVSLESKDGVAVDVYYPYSRDASGQLQHGRVFEVEGHRLIFNG